MGDGAISRQRRFPGLLCDPIFQRLQGSASCSVLLTDVEFSFETIVRSRKLFRSAFSRISHIETKRVGDGGAAGLVYYTSRSLFAFSAWEG